MVFEVDNTTEKLIDALQKSIEDTIAVLENGQRDLQGLIEATKTICEDTATADQADAISKQLSGLREEQRKAATAQQIKDLGTAVDAVHGQAKQELAEMAGIKEEITGLCQSTAVFENGQQYLRKMIEETKEVCGDTATADQADAISKQLSGLREEQRKAATAQQIKDLGTAVDAVHGQAKQELAEMVGIKEEITGLCQSTQANHHTVLNAQKEIRDQLVQQLSEQINRSETDRLHSLQELSNQLMELSSGLAGRLDTLVSSSSSTVKTVARNQAMLAAITAYLSLPGYKRFFKGMEVIQHETTQ